MPYPCSSNCQLLNYDLQETWRKQRAIPDSTPIRPRALHPGDTIGIISPSWFGGEAFVPRARRGIETLESFGFKVKVGRHAFNNLGHLSDAPENRVTDLHDMFADETIRAIICTIGGDHSNQLLPLIDFDLIARNPKIFLGIVGRHRLESCDMVKDPSGHFQRPIIAHRMGRVSTDA